MFKATYKGKTIGWYDTRSEAEDAETAARLDERDEQDEYRRWLNSNLGD